MFTGCGKLGGLPDGMEPPKPWESAMNHASDCAVHNAPAYDAGPCDCVRGADGYLSERVFDGVRYLDQESAAKHRDRVDRAFAQFAEDTP
jgi:hypothetical protein